VEKTIVPQPIVIGLGELLWDMFPDGRKAGGAPANFAFHANQLGCRGLPASRVGRDALGDELVTFLEQQGLSTELIQRDANHLTGTVTVELDAQGHPSYVIHTDVAWDQLAADDALLETAKRANSICFGTLGQRSTTARETIRRVIANAGPECLIVFDVNLRQQFYSREIIEQSLRLANVVKLNDEEVSALASMGIISAADNDLVDFGRDIIDRFGPRLVCITQGSDGATLVSATDAVRIPGRRVEIADTVGAGDAFTAALVATLLTGRPLSQCGEIANEVGALVASRPGAMPELRGEFQRILNSAEG
jgi:fructokinase